MGTTFLFVYNRPQVDGQLARVSGSEARERTVVAEVTAGNLARGGGSGNGARERTVAARVGMGRERRSFSFFPTLGLKCSNGRLFVRSRMIEDVRLVRKETA